MQGLTSYLDATTSCHCWTYSGHKGKWPLSRTTTQRKHENMMTLSQHIRWGAGEIPPQTAASVEHHLRKRHPGVNPDLFHSSTVYASHCGGPYGENKTLSLPAGSLQSCWRAETRWRKHWHGRSSSKLHHILTAGCNKHSKKSEWKKKNIWNTYIRNWALKVIHRL